MDTKAQSAQAQRINDVTCYIRQNVDGPLPRDELAQAAGYSVPHFHRLFREQVGEPVSAYVRRVRLEWAAHQLLPGDHDVVEIAFRRGYNTHSAFGRAFKGYFGVSPSAFCELAPATAAYLINRPVPYRSNHPKACDTMKRILTPRFSICFLGFT